jgi:hypothetical protein
VAKGFVIGGDEATWEELVGPRFGIRVEREALHIIVLRARRGASIAERSRCLRGRGGGGGGWGNIKFDVFLKKQLRFRFGLYVELF